MGQQFVITLPDGFADNDILQILRDLKPKDKKEIARDVTRGFFESEEAFDIKTYKKLIVADVRLGNIKTARRVYSDTTDEEILSFEEVRRLLAARISPKDAFLIELREQILELYRVQIAEEIKTDPRIETIKSVTIEELVKEFPTLIQSALVQAVAQQFGDFGKKATESIYMGLETNAMTHRIRETLQGRGLGPI